MTGANPRLDCLLSNMKKREKREKQEKREK
jgi:hypothetical protein